MAIIIQIIWIRPTSLRNISTIWQTPTAPKASIHQKNPPNHQTEVQDHFSVLAFKSISPNSTTSSKKPTKNMEFMISFSLLLTWKKNLFLLLITWERTIKNQDESVFLTKKIPDPSKSLMNSKDSQLKPMRPSTSFCIASNAFSCQKMCSVWLKTKNYMIFHFLKPSPTWEETSWLQRKTTLRILGQITFLKILRITYKKPLLFRCICRQITQRKNSIWRILKMLIVKIMKVFLMIKRRVILVFATLVHSFLRLYFIDE